eukprot:CAMPEP_0113673436 /NCGR_PEP_ID=MMETSP0038_2-20120614/6857_1 /TAXON_ID=2898 /ORGANISM="Cryptomonas paramecium" /LENGTH=143 /DNA_ID=CAMNT_0000589895 /DNA_START=122 /DNA_END=553 /DNA_ORIENTATION=+ /assembly_acc=CAM_ASM_000170
MQQQTTEKNMLASADQEEAAEKSGRRLRASEIAGFTECRQQCSAGRDVAACKDCERPFHRSQSVDLNSFPENFTPLRRVVSDSSALPPPRKFVRRQRPVPKQQSHVFSLKPDSKLDIENLSTTFSFDDELFLLMLDMSIMLKE